MSVLYNKGEKNMMRTIITGTGNYIPETIKTNDDFSEQLFYNADGSQLAGTTSNVIHKFLKITGIAERRYVRPNQTASEIAAISAAAAISDAGIDPEKIDVIIVAHNFGDVAADHRNIETVPALASRVKNRLAIKNPSCIAFDVLFGCPGWVMALIQVEAFFKAGMYKTALVIGVETLSRVIDISDRDSMIFSDGAGAAVLEFKASDHAGVLSMAARSDCSTELDFLRMAPAFQDGDTQIRYMKMNGRKVYEYALRHVPAAMMQCLDSSGESIQDLKKIFIHQANEKMDEAIVDAFYALYGMATPASIMPMCVHYLGNSSVATIPTLFDLVRKGCDPLHELQSGDLVLFASVGAGMNINAVTYRCA